MATTYMPTTVVRRPVPPVVPDRVSVTWTRERLRTWLGGLGGSGFWYGFLAAATGETAEHRRLYPEMAFREAGVKAPLLTRIWSVASLDLQVMPASKSPADRRVADAYRHAILHSHMGLPHVVAEIGLPAAIHGEALCEMPLNDEVESSGQWAEPPLRMIRAVKAKPPASYQIRRDDFGNAVSVRSTSGGAEWPINKFIHYQWLSLFGDSVSDLRAAVRAFNSKETISRLRLFYLDKLSGPYLVGKVGNSEMKQQMLEKLLEARGQGAIAVDATDDVTAVDLAMGSDAAFDSAMQYYDRELNKAIGASDLPFQQGQTTDGRGNTQVQREVTSQAEWKLAADVGWLLTRAARGWLDENFVSADLPEVRLAGVDHAAIKSDGELALIANQLVDLSADEVHERLGWGPPKGVGDAVPRTAKAAPGVAAGGFGLELANTGGGHP